MSDKYPEHEKMRAIDAGEKRGVTEFLEWLDEHGYHICARSPGARFDTHEPIPMRIEQWLGEFFQIDKAAIDREKDAMLEELRALHAQPIDSRELFGRVYPPPVTGIGDAALLEVIRKEHFPDDT